jgi:hypothetical protein
MVEGTPKGAELIKMKILLTISALVFTVMFGSTSFAEWTKLGSSVSGDTFVHQNNKARHFVRWA